MLFNNNYTNTIQKYSLLYEVKENNLMYRVSLQNTAVLANTLVYMPTVGYKGEVTITVTVVPLVQNIESNRHNVSSISNDIDITLSTPLIPCMNIVTTNVTFHVTTAIKTNIICYNTIQAYEDIVFNLNKACSFKPFISTNVANKYNNESILVYIQLYATNGSFNMIEPYKNLTFISSGATAELLTPLSNIQNILNNINYIPELNFHGNVTLMIKTQIKSNTNDTISGVNDINNITISIIPVNDLPQISIRPTSKQFQNNIYTINQTDVLKLDFIEIYDIL